jgi:hypothetical protein
MIAVPSSTTFGWDSVVESYFLKKKSCVVAHGRWIGSSSFIVTKLIFAKKEIPLRFLILSIRQHFYRALLYKKSDASQKRSSEQGCQMIYFPTKIPILVKFGGSFNGKCWSILWPFGLFYSHLVYCMAIWYIFFRFGVLYQEKSGNPASEGRRELEKKLSERAAPRPIHSAKS